MTAQTAVFSANEDSMTSLRARAAKELQSLQSVTSEQKSRAPWALNGEQLATAPDISVQVRQSMVQQLETIVYSPEEHVRDMLDGYADLEK